MHEEPFEFQFLREEIAEEERARGRGAQALALSMVVHGVVVLMLLLEPKIFPGLHQALVEQQPRIKGGPITYLAPPPEDYVPPPRATPPVMPPKAEMEKLVAKAPEPKAPAPQPPTPTPQTQAPEGKPKGSPEPQQLAQTLPPAPVPQQEGPKLMDLTPRESPKLSVPMPGGSVSKGMEDTLKSVVKDRASGGAVYQAPSGGSFDARQPAQLGGAQILSDTQGVDFSPYLQRVLFEIRRNWYVSMPEMARMGKKGRVVIQFEVLKDGSVPKLWLVGSSQSDPLDKAALASISASNPFQPLPSEYKGQSLRLQLMFLYNIPMDQR